MVEEDCREDKLEMLPKISCEVSDASRTAPYSLLKMKQMKSARFALRSLVRTTLWRNLNAMRSMYSTKSASAHGYNKVRILVQFAEPRSTPKYNSEFTYFQLFLLN